jgi:hypothetical protein
LTEGGEEDDDALAEDGETVTEGLGEGGGEDDVSLTSLTITDNEFTLTLSDREENVNKTKTSMNTNEATRTALNRRRSTIKESLSNKIEGNDGETRRRENCSEAGERRW